MSQPSPKSSALPRTLLSLLLCGAAASALAAPVKVGLALDISGPFAALGAEARDGFALGIKQLGGKLGGQEVEFVQADMAGSPDQAKQLVDRMIQRDKIDLFSGPIGSNVALAVGPTLFNAKVPYLSANAGPSQFAGAQCNAYFFGTAYQNDQFHEAAGKFAQDRAFKKIVLIAPNYPAGKDALGGFKRQFKGQVADELYTKLGQIDYAAELAQLRASKPDSIYFFLPGAMGINFIKQFVGAGLSKDITLVTSGDLPEEVPSETVYAQTAIAAFFAEHLAFAPPSDMTGRPEPCFRLKVLDNVSIVDFRVYAKWEQYSIKHIPFDRSGGQRMRTLAWPRPSRGVCPLGAAVNPAASARSARGQRAAGAQAQRLPANYAN